MDRSTAGMQRISLPWRAFMLHAMSSVVTRAWTGKTSFGTLENLHGLDSYHCKLCTCTASPTESARVHKLIEGQGDGACSALIKHMEHAAGRPHEENECYELGHVKCITPCGVIC